MMTKNYVEARGKIIKIEDESITLLVKRGPDESEMTFLLADALDPSISRRDIVEVSGHIGLAQIGINEKGRSMIDQYLIADSVKPSKTTLEMMCGVKGNIEYPEHYFRCCIVGTFIHIAKRNDEWGRIFISPTSDADWDKRIMLNYYLKGLIPKPEKFKRGDEIALVVDIKVNSKEYELEDGSKETRTFENLYVEDIVVLNKADKEVKTYGTQIMQRLHIA